MGGQGLPAGCVRTDSEPAGQRTPRLGPGAGLGVHPEQEFANFASADAWVGGSTKGQAARARAPSRPGPAFSRRQGCATRGLLRASARAPLVLNTRSYAAAAAAAAVAKSIKHFKD